MKMMTFNPANCRPVSQTNRPAMNIRKEDQAIELQFTVPGFRREDLNIRVEDNHLVITGTPPAEEVNGFVRREFRPLAFEKKFKLGDRVATDAIQAKVEDGILHVTIGLTEPIRREIAVA